MISLAYAWQFHSTVFRCECSDSTLSQLEEQAVDLKNSKDLMIRYKQWDIKNSAMKQT